MTPIEKFAREICWAGFTTPVSRKGKTKAGYWKNEVCADAKLRYVSDAEYFSWLLRALPVEVLNDAHDIRP